MCCAVLTVNGGRGFDWYLTFRLCTAIHFYTPTSSPIILPRPSLRPPLVLSLAPELARAVGRGGHRERKDRGGVRNQLTCMWWISVMLVSFYTHMREMVVMRMVEACRGKGTSRIAMMKWLFLVCSMPRQMFYSEYVGAVLFCAGIGVD